jgi:hypothetical protein
MPCPSQGPSTTLSVATMLPERAVSWTRACVVKPSERQTAQSRRM